jgi:hypothetical protein
MAEEAVSYEPVSECISLLVGKIQGKLRALATLRGIRHRIDHGFQ